MAETALLSPGLIVADTYEIDRLLGRGGMGEVWLARHRRLAGKQVAVKVLRLEGAVSSEALARFRREAEIAARLEHPNIVQVLDFNTLPTGEPFLVMELLKGESLAQRLSGGPLPLDAVQNVVRQAGAALQAAHRAGVVHRDLKPENIFLIPTALGDQVKVLDFGISKLTDSKTVQTTDAVLIGTPLYMSPEQALGNNRDVTAQSDLFSLGSICYELLTGEPPFAADSVARVVFRIAYEKYAPLSERRADLPAAVVAAVDHALEKDRTKRTADIDTFVVELTGEPLGTPSQPTTAGMYNPGMDVSASMLSAKTAHPSRQPLKATPSTREPLPSTREPLPSTREAPPDGDAPVSGKKLAVGLVVAALLISAGVVGVRRYWQSLPTPGPAKPTVELPLSAVADAGRGQGNAAVPNVASLDASMGVGLEVEADAGRLGSAPRPPSTTPRVEFTADVPTAKDRARLSELDAAAARGDWEYLEAQRSSVRGLESRTARARAVSLVVMAMCRRSSNLLLASTIAELKRVATPAVVRNVRRECEAVYPSAASFEW